VDGRRNRTHTCPAVNCPNVDGTLLPAVIDQIFVENRDFYRATRMHSADYAVARCLSVCLSVRPSHAGIVCKRLHISTTFFHHWVAQPNGMTIFRRGPPNGGAECKGRMKNHNLQPISGFISELIQNKAMVTMEGE